MGATSVRERLDPSVFNLPVERIRDGYYSDAYFTFSKEVLEAEDHRPPVTMRVFQKKAALLGGVDEAIAILRLCSGRRLPYGRWEDGWDALTVRALHEGDEIAPHEAVMRIEGDYSLFAHLETVYLGCMARREPAALRARPARPRRRRPRTRAHRRLRLGSTPSASASSRRSGAGGLLRRRVGALAGSQRLHRRRGALERARVREGGPVLCRERPARARDVDDGRLARSPRRP